MKETLTKYLIKQNVSIELAEEKGISINASNKIVIPIYDNTGKEFLFNKYRRSPEEQSTDIPKYTYDAGSKAALYNSSTIKKGVPVIITEGEFKALCLESYGFIAVSSTGGAGSFNKEWIELFNDNDVYIIFDTDEAGIRGAFALNQKIPKAKIVFLPRGDWGKDVNEFCSAVGGTFKGKIDSLIANSVSWYFDIPTDFETKTELSNKIKEIKLLSEVIKNKRYEIESSSLDGKGDCRHLEIYNDILWTHIGRLNKLGKFFKRYKLENTYKDEFHKAKLVPIHLFVKFNYQNFATSVWNKNDKNPSMKYYPSDNRVYDYSTGRGGDSIDVAQALWGLGFKETLNKLNNIK